MLNIVKKKKKKTHKQTSYFYNEVKQLVFVLAVKVCIFFHPWHVFKHESLKTALCQLSKPQQVVRSMNGIIQQADYLL